VVVVPGLQAHDLRTLAPRGAVGLLVPGAGPETSARAARVMLAQGVIRNSLRGAPPPGPVRIRVEQSQSIPTGGRFIVLGLPQGGAQLNNRRYGIAVVAPGYRGLLTSPNTRIPGLVTIADVAPTLFRSRRGVKRIFQGIPREVGGNRHQRTKRRRNMRLTGKTGLYPHHRHHHTFYNHARL
jgi:hypothetical protein